MIKRYFITVSSVRTTDGCISRC